MNLIEAHRAIWDAGLVVGTSGNVSFRADKYMHIKPSGVSCADIGVSCPVRLSDGRITVGHRPSTDSEAHRYIYNHLTDVGAIVHTHSTYATAFAVVGRPIPCVMTALSDMFGGDVPVSRYCYIGDEDIGEEVVRLYKKSPAVLIRQHGVFTVGKTLNAAVKAAIMVEDCAKTIWHAEQIGKTEYLTTEEVQDNYARYNTTYGQRA